MNQKNENNIVEIYVQLLEEGTPTIRPTNAVKIQEGIYKLLPVKDYDPEDEIWEFVPGTIVRGVDTVDDMGEKILLAVNKSE